MRFNHTKLALNLIAIAGLAGGCQQTLRTTVPIVESGTTTTRAAELVAMPAPVALPMEGCSLEGPVAAAVPLRLAPHAPVLATLKGASFARVRMGGSFEAVAAPFRLRAIATGLSVFAKEPITFGTSFVPSGKRALPVTAFDDARIVTSLMGVTKSIACASVALEPSEIDLSTFDEGEAKRVGNEDVVVIDRQADRARVVRWQDEVAILEWVPMRALLPPMPKAHPSVETAPSLPPEPTSVPTRCDRELALVGEVAGMRRRIGAIDASGDFVMGEHDGDFTEVTPYGGPLKMSEGARLLVRSADLGGCATASP